MIPALEKNKRIDIQKDKIVVKARVEISDFDMHDRIQRLIIDLLMDVEDCSDSKEFFGIARLKEGDKDNVREAVHIAESKMERQFYMFVASGFRKKKQKALDFIDLITKEIQKANNNIHSIGLHIVDIVENMDKED